MTETTQLPKIHLGLSEPNSGKIKHFSWKQIDGENMPQRITFYIVSWLPAAAVSPKTGPVSKAVFAVSHLDRKTWENKVQVEKDKINLVR